MKWTAEYPKVGGHYWMKLESDGEAIIELFWPNNENKIVFIDNEYNEYGAECFQDCYFSDKPIEQPGV